MLAPNSDAQPAFPYAIPSTSRPAPQRRLTRKQLRANRRHAKQSTGPRTAQGKQIASRNAITHGVFSAALVLPGEDAPLFFHLRRDYVAALRPQDCAELSLVDRMLAAQWKLNRVQAAEALIYDGCFGGLKRVAEHNFELFTRYYKVRTLDDIIARRGRIGETPAVDGDRELARTFLDLERLARCEPEEAHPAAMLAVMARGGGVDAGIPTEGDEDGGGIRRPRKPAGDDARALDRLGRYERSLQSEVSRCLRDLGRLRELAAASAELPESPFLADAVNMANGVKDTIEGEEASFASCGARATPAGPGAAGDEPRGTSAAPSNFAPAPAPAQNEQNEPTAAKSCASAGPADTCDDPSRQNDGGGGPERSADPG